ncbi:MAG TPA: hypothetical protein VEX35_00270 [Allosphingosinicella sp.]|nr:hypothetical protein [Allosphingosinicella sp.]
MIRKRRYVIDGRGWLIVSRAAELLGTNAQSVRKLMGEGALEWRQTRANSRTFVVDEAGVVALKKNRPPVKLKRSPDPLARPPNPVPERRARGGLSEAHHLRLTLPHDDEAGDKRKKR